MKEERISKINFWASYFRAGELLSDENELYFYRALFHYFFDGIEPDFDNMPKEVQLVFTSIIGFVNAEINKKNGGASLGNTNASKGVTCRKCRHRKSCTREDDERDAEDCEDYEESISTSQNNPKQPKTNNVNDNVNVNGNGNEVVLGTSQNEHLPPSPPPSTQSDKDNEAEVKKSLEDWLKATDLKKSKKDKDYIRRIKAFLANTGLSIDYLDYLYKDALNKYSVEQITLGLLIKAMEWQDKVNDYKKSIENKTLCKDSPVNKRFCRCGGILFADSPGLWGCNACGKWYRLKAGGQSGELEECTA